MYLDCFKNCGKDYLRVVNNKYSNNNGKVKISRITVKNLGYLSNYDDGKPDLLKRLRQKFKEGTLVDLDELNVSYKEKDQQDYEEGLYLLDIIYESKTISLGIGSDCVSYGGIQYETEKGSLDEVVNIFTKYLD